jgi:DNA-binding CsgD family transcriptional regulator
VLCDPLTELLAAGARIGDHQRTQPLQRQLLDQLSGLPPTGPGPACANWVELQVALATEDWTQVSKVDRTLTPSDPRGKARVAARQAWALVAQGESDADTIRAAASALTEVNDAWEASRLLGQAALDQNEPTIARSLLEEARLLVTEPVAASDGLVGAGLSEREAEVARLVAQGRAYKAIGSQLFISPKTVEHHVAKIRQRLGASSRAELLAMIREIA